MAVLVGCDSGRTSTSVSNESPVGSSPPARGTATPPAGSQSPAPGQRKTTTTTTETPFVQAYGPLIAAIVALALAGGTPLVGRAVYAPKLGVEHCPEEVPEDRVPAGDGGTRWRARVVNKGRGSWARRTAKDVEVIAVELSIDGERKTVSGRRLPWTIALDTDDWKNAKPLRIPNEVERYLDVLEPRGSGAVSVPLKPLSRSQQARFDIPWDRRATEGGEPVERCVMTLAVVADDVQASRWKASIVAWPEANDSAGSPVPDTDRLVLTITSA